MGRWKKNPHLEVQLLKILSESPDGLRSTELFKLLKPGSKTTHTQLLNTLVVAEFIKHHYLTKTFRITDRGREAIGQLVHNLRAMDFLADSGIFRDENDGVLAAIQFCLTNYEQFRGVDIRMVAPFEVDAKGNLTGLPSTPEEWEKKEKQLGLRRKISHDAEEELASELQLFCKKHPHQLSFSLKKYKSNQFQFELHRQAWPKEVAGALTLLFFSDQNMAPYSLPILKNFLRKQYETFIPEKLNQKLIAKIHKSAR